ncbi:MAG: riboflavin kinase / adenylyltransferase [Campylobacterota bacterium]|nr:riboflavin kinase / adenylyltransferase [Campylobacterota bacterium]
MHLTNQITSIAIGSFDGMHIAHQVLIKQVQAIVIIERNGGYLTPGHKRTLYAGKECHFYHFEKISSLAPEAFVQRLKSDFPSLKKIVVGYDFHFGKSKAGNAQRLKELFDGEVYIVEEVSTQGVAVHSRSIKTYLKEGSMEMANLLLGRVYQIEGKIIHGQGLGKKALVPTLNLYIDHYQLPKEGVYATRTKIKQKWHQSVSFVGHRISIDGSYAVETHILNENLGEIEGTVLVEFLAFLRENKKFESLDALKTQIDKDIKQAGNVG